MRLQTAASVISLARRLEEESGRFYEELAARYVHGKDIFLPFARENARNITQVERAYYSTISDAIEGCFAFDIEPPEIDVAEVVSDSFDGALRQAIAVEEKIAGFYDEAARQSKNLLADVPRSLAVIARKKNERILQLKSLLRNGTA